MIGKASSSAHFNKTPASDEAAGPDVCSHRSSANSTATCTAIWASLRHSYGTGNTRFDCHAPSALISAYAAGVAQATLTMPQRGAATRQIRMFSNPPAVAIHASTFVRRSMYRPEVTTAYIPLKTYPTRITGTIGRPNQ